MAYTRLTFTFNNSIEYEFHYQGNYGAKGEKRAPRQKKTPEQQQKVNQRRKERDMRHLIKANFFPNDIWVTLKYPKGLRKPLDGIKKDFAKFRTKMRQAYKQYGEEFKYIYRMEIGSRGGIHIHMLINRSRGRPDTEVLIQDMWTEGRANYQNIYEAGGYKDLAEYIVKQPDKKVMKQISFFEPDEQKEFIKYSCSRNLIRPEPERKEFTQWTLRKLIEEGPKPKAGYYIDKDSVECGVNPYTGMSYLRYTEVRIKEIKRNDPGGDYG